MGYNKLKLHLSTKNRTREFSVDGSGNSILAIAECRDHIVEMLPV